MIRTKQSRSTLLDQRLSFAQTAIRPQQDTRQQRGAAEIEADAEQPKVFVHARVFAGKRPAIENQLRGAGELAVTPRMQRDGNFQQRRT